MRSLLQSRVNKQLITSPVMTPFLPWTANWMAVFHSVRQTYKEKRSECNAKYELQLQTTCAGFPRANMLGQKWGLKAGPHYRNRHEKKKSKLTWTLLSTVIFMKPAFFPRLGHDGAYSDIFFFQNGGIFYISLIALHAFKGSCLLFASQRILCASGLGFLCLPQYTTIGLQAALASTQPSRGTFAIQIFQVSLRKITYILSTNTFWTNMYLLEEKWRVASGDCTFA